MKIVNPSRDDIELFVFAHRAFGLPHTKDWLIDRLHSQSDRRKLEILKDIDVPTILTIVNNNIPEEFKENFPQDSIFENCHLTMAAYRIKKGFNSSIWVAVVRTMVNEQSYLLGYLSAKNQVALWTKLYDLIRFQQDLYLSFEDAIDYIDED